jgi:hypothetical protein
MHINRRGQLSFVNGVTYDRTCEEEACGGEECVGEGCGGEAGGREG